jgi:chemotaxis protein CheX
VNQHESLIFKALVDSTVQVFSTMLGVEVVAGPRTVERGLPEVNDGVVSFIGLAGCWTGAGSLVCSPGLACRACAQMLMTEAPAVNDEVLDTVAELTNMIIGGVKTEIEGELGPLGLSIPTVVYGRNFKAKGGAHMEWTVAPFDWEGEQLLVKLCLAPSPDAHAHAHVPAHGHSYALEV